MTTPVALITGSSDGRKTRLSSASVSRAIRSVTRVSVESEPSPPPMAERTAAAAPRNAMTVASVPNRVSSARTCASWRRRSMDGISLKSGMRETCGLGRAHERRAILQYYVIIR